MKWFDKWLYKKVRDMWDHSYKYDSKHEVISSGKLAPISEDLSLNMDNSLRFNVLPAQGGTIIEIRNYDRRDERNHTSTYVIPDNEDLSTSIAHIVSMELLKKG